MLFPPLMIYAIIVMVKKIYSHTLVGGGAQSWKTKRSLGIQNLSLECVVYPPPPQMQQWWLSSLNLSTLSQSVKQSYRTHTKIYYKSLPNPQFWSQRNVMHQTIYPSHLPKEPVSPERACRSHPPSVGLPELGGGGFRWAWTKLIKMFLVP